MLPCSTIVLRSISAVYCKKEREREREKKKENIFFFHAKFCMTTLSIKRDEKHKQVKIYQIGHTKIFTKLNKS